VRRTFRIYRALMAAAIRTELQYRGNFLSATIGGILFQGVGIAFIGVVVQRFGAVGGWSFGEIALLYGMRLTSHALWTVPCAPVFGSDRLVRTGDFDRFLIRPVRPFVQLIAGRFVLQTCGDLVGGVSLLVVATLTVDLDWSPIAVSYLLLAVVGGALVELGLHLAISASSFRLGSVRSFRIVIDQIFNTFGGYPQKIFPIGVRFGLTFVLPAAFVAYFPATVLLDRTDELFVHPWIAMAAPAVGGLVFLAAYRLWAHQMLHYQSVGH